MKSVIAIVLAGGYGGRLKNLTDGRSKPALEWGAVMRFIDIILSSIENSGIQKAWVLTQYHQQTLLAHILNVWVKVCRIEVEPVPSQQKIGEEWYRGTADAVYQNLDMFERVEEQSVRTAIICCADHIIKIDFRDMNRVHLEHKADLTMSFDVIPVSMASEFGIVEVDENFRVIGFEEKPLVPKEIPGRPGFCFASMGTYCVDLQFLKKIVSENALDPDSGHDFGKDIIPKIIHTSMVYGYDFSNHLIEGEQETYWRDAGTVRSYFDSNIDLTEFNPRFNMYNPLWPMRMADKEKSPGAKTVRDCLIGFCVTGRGVIIDQSTVRHTVLGHNIRIEENCHIERTVILSGSVVNRNCKIKNTIIDKRNFIPEGTIIGYNLTLDEARGFSVIDGITLVPKNFFPKK